MRTLHEKVQKSVKNPWSFGLKSAEDSPVSEPLGGESVSVQLLVRKSAVPGPWNEKKKRKRRGRRRRRKLGRGNNRRIKEKLRKIRKGSEWGRCWGRDDDKDDKEGERLNITDNEISKLAVILNHLVRDLRYVLDDCVILTALLSWTLKYVPCYVMRPVCLACWQEPVLSSRKTRVILSEYSDRMIFLYKEGTSQSATS